MAYLLSQLMISLLLAGVVGGAIGWIVHGYKAHQREQGLRDAIDRQGMMLAQVQSERQMIADEFDEMKLHLEGRISDLQHENRQIPALNENLEKSQALVRQMIQTHDHDLMELNQANQKISAELNALSSREQNQLAEIAVLKRAHSDNQRQVEASKSSSTAASRADMASNTTGNPKPPINATPEHETLSPKDQSNQHGTDAERTPNSLNPSTSVVQASTDLASSTPQTGNLNTATDAYTRLDDTLEENSIPQEFDSLSEDLDTLEPNALASDGITVESPYSHDGSEHNDSDQFDTLMEIDEDYDDLELLEDAAADLSITADQTQSTDSQQVSREDSLTDESDSERQQQLFDDAESIDDLKCIHGIGPVIEKSLNEIGITSFRQIAHLTRKEVQEIADILEIFPGRIERDNWVGSAKKLITEELEEA